MDWLIILAVPVALIGWHYFCPYARETRRIKRQNREFEEQIRKALNHDR